MRRSADVDYAELLSSEHDKERVHRLAGQHSRADADGVPQVCFIGVINLMTASKHVPKERLGATDDCGFSPFSVDVEPKHGSPDVARDIAFQNITERVKGAAMASAKLGLPA